MGGNGVKFRSLAVKLGEERGDWGRRELYRGLRVGLHTWFLWMAGSERKRPHHFFWVGDRRLRHDGIIAELVVCQEYTPTIPSRELIQLQHKIPCTVIECIEIHWIPPHD